MIVEKIKNLLIYFVGTVFFVTGLSKVLVFDSFQISIQKFTFYQISNFFILIIAVIVILIEIFAGLMIVFNYKRTIGAVLLLILTSIFDIVISFNYFFGTEKIICNCFGIIPIAFSTLSHLLLNLILILILFFQCKEMGRGFQYYIYLSIVFINLILPIIVYTISPGKSSIIVNQEEKYKINIVDKSMVQQFASLDQKLILYMDIMSFSCDPCEKSFYQICDHLDNNIEQYKRNSVFIFVKESYENNELFNKMIIEWKNKRKIKFSIILDSLKIFQNNNINENSLLILDDKNTITEYETYPFDFKRISKILHKYEK